MRIAHVTFSFWPIRGGADAYLAELWKALHAAGHEQTVYQAEVAAQGELASSVSLINCKKDADSPAARGGRRTIEWENRTLEVVEWPAPLHLPAGRRFWLLTAQAARHREELSRYDRIVAHYPNYALPLLGHPGLVGLSHGVTWDCSRSRADRAKRFIAEVAYRSARRYVSNDTFFLREMGLPLPPGSRPWEEVAPGRWYLPNAVDVERFRPDPSVPKEPVLLLARNFYRNRGIQLGIEAFALLADEFPEYRLRIAGGAGDAGYREECEALAESLGIASRVEFAGPTPWREMANEYRRAAVSLVPSLCGEGTSLSALESMACGTPVAASRAGGLPDLPCLHADATAPALADALRVAIRQREELSEQQREIVTHHFRLEKWAEAWREVIGAS